MMWLQTFRFCLLSLLLIIGYQGHAQADPNWDQFKSAFIRNGRVIDQGQNGISHSEGQGMAMLLAVQNNDPDTFKQLWGWTQVNLQVRNDKLFAWSWSPDVGINDTNNASDGDLLIAWALSRAYSQWHDPSFLYEALRISQSIRKNLLRKTSKGLVIIPGATGFDKPNGLKLNLSYWIFPAITDLSMLDSSPEWAELRTTGLQLIEEAQFGKWHLPPNWLILNDSSLSMTDDDRFGYDAVRIPLYLIWGKEATPTNMKPFQGFWNQFQGKESMPSWVDLKNNNMGTYNASIGFHNVAKLTISFPHVDGVQLPKFDPMQGYYSSMLTLFTQSALEEYQK